VALDLAKGQRIYDCSLEDLIDTEIMGRIETYRGHCPLITERFSKSFQFSSLKNFSLRNLIQASTRHEIFKESIIRILQVQDQTTDIKVDFSFDTSDPELLDYLDFSSDSSSLEIRFPSVPLPPTDDRERQCVETETLIYVRPGLSLENFDVESLIMSVKVPGPIVFTVDRSDISIHVGKLEASPMLNSRESCINVSAGGVFGEFPIYDTLSIFVKAGSIVVDAIPQEPITQEQKPVKLVVETHAGPIHLQYPRVGTHIPDREYQVKVTSDIGTIDGRFIHGTTTSLKSNTGEIQADIIPFSSDRYNSELSTETVTGRQMIKVLSPYIKDDLMLRRLEGNHISTHGSVDVTYPLEWVGVIEAVSNVGRVHVGGEGLKIVQKSRRGVVGMLIEAEKGDSECRSRCKTTMGSVNFQIADNSPSSSK
jgi:hypothetical protein